MKLTDYLLRSLYQTWLDNGESNDDSTNFLDFLQDDLGFRDLARYHLDSDDALVAKIDNIQAREGVRFKNMEDKVLYQMYVLLGQEIAQSYNSISGNVLLHSWATELHYQVMYGRNAIYLTAYTDDKQVVAETSYKMSSNAVAHRHYNFEAGEFSDWEIERQVCDQTAYDTNDPAYVIRQYLLQNLLDDTGETRFDDEILTTIMSGVTGKSQANSKQDQADNKTLSNQDW